MELREVLGRLRFLRQALLPQQLDQDARAEQRLRVEQNEPLLDGKKAVEIGDGGQGTGASPQPLSGIRAARVSSRAKMVTLSSRVGSWSSRWLRGLLRARQGRGGKGGTL